MILQTIQHYPVEIKRLGREGIAITWDDGREDQISSKVLRENCPSAVSLAKRGDASHDKPLTAPKVSLRVIQHTVDEELSLEEIWAVGNYALGMRWADGHDSGIYTYQHLRTLGEQ